MSKLIEGFVYTRAGMAVAKERKVWREMLQQVIADGGFRRAENGETFAHDKRGLIVFEVYAIIPA